MYTMYIERVISKTKFQKPKGSSKMSNVIETVVYDVKDLKKNEELKELVIEKNYDLNVDNDWWSESTLETWKDILSTMGFYDSCIMFSGFCSQGDGACFTTDFYSYEKGFITKLKTKFPKWNELHEVAKSLQKAYQKTKYQAYGKITHSGMYYHEMSTNIKVLQDFKEYGEGWVKEEIATLFEDVLVDINKLIYKHLQEDYEYLTSEEAIMETIESNDYTFDEDGKLVG